MGTTATIDDPGQLELIEDDPRVPAEELGPLQLIRAFRAAKNEHGDLIARPLAAEILGVGANQIGVWTARGRLTDVRVGSVKLVPAAEVLALFKEREIKINVGGRKLPSMAEVVRLGSQIQG